MDILKAIILGFIQGATEFLPVSSSGHLVIATHLLGLTDPESNLAFIVFLHFVSALAIVAYFANELWRFITNAKTLTLLIIATIPGGLAGFALKGVIENFFMTYLFLVGLALFITALILFFGGMTGWGRNFSLTQLNLKIVLLVGLAQAVAIIPGISRSGMTISAGLMLGLERQTAAKFSFFLALPVILGAALYELKDFSKFTTSFEPISILVGGITCFLTSLLAIKLLLKIIHKSRLYYFSIYCVALGLVIIGVDLIK